MFFPDMTVNTRRIKQKLVQLVDDWGWDCVGKNEDKKSLFYYKHFWIVFVF